MTILIRVGAESHHAVDRVLPSVLKLLQPDRTKIEATRLPDDRLDVWVELTQAKLVQLPASQVKRVLAEQSDQPCLPNEVLRYVPQKSLAQALVDGRVTQALCGAGSCEDAPASIAHLSGLCQGQLPVSPTAPSALVSIGARDQ